MNQKALWLGILIIFIALVVWLVRTPGRPGKLDAFAQCLSESGAKYYGAFWCPNCKNQEALFGSSKKFLPRTECSTPDGRGQLPVCQEAQINGYPTWIFPDGERVTGTQTLEDLSAKSNCALPETQ